MKHTPGPWEAVKVQHLVKVVDSEGETVARVTAIVHPQEEAVANARLMAAAPKLLEVLDWLLHLAHGCSKGGQDCPVTAEEWTDAWGEAKAAIAKAREGGR